MDEEHMDYEDIDLFASDYDDENEDRDELDPFDRLSQGYAPGADASPFTTAFDDVFEGEAGDSSLLEELGIEEDEFDVGYSDDEFPSDAFDADAETVLEELAGDEEVAGFFQDLGRAAKSVVRSPITKAVAGAAAFVVPPVGISATAALMAADKIVGGVKSKRPRKRKAARKIVVGTHRAAKRGNKNAKRGLKVLQVALRARNKRVRKLRSALLKRKRSLAVRKRSAASAKRALLATRKKGRRMLRELKLCKRKLSRLKRVPGVLVMKNGAIVRGNWYRRK